MIFFSAHDNYIYCRNLNIWAFYSLIRNLNEDWYQTAIQKFKINEISYNELSEEQTRIGRGGFGLIYRTKCKSIGVVAIKEITITNEDDETCIKNFINEVI